MADFEMEFELTGLKVKIKSNRGDASSALQNFNNQFGNLLHAAADTPAPSSPLPFSSSVSRAIDAPAVSDNSKSKNSKRKRSNSGGGAALEFKHDAAKFGSPKQSWTTAQKSMWLLYMVEKQCGEKEQSTPTLASTFNKFFKEFGPITTTNVTRDMGAARAKQGWVNSDASKDPQTWYLLDAGKKQVEILISTGSGEPAK